MARESKNEFDGGMFSGIEIENIWKEVDYLGYTTPIYKLVREQINSTIDQFYDGFENEYLVNGINSLKYLSTKISTFCLLSETEQDELLNSLHMILYKNNYRRIFWTSFLDDIPKEMINEDIKEYKMEFESIQKEWDKMLTKILMLKFRKNEKTYMDISNAFLNVIKKEIICGEILKKYAKVI